VLLSCSDGWPDLIILAPQLASLDRLDVCRRVAAESGVPVVVLGEGRDEAAELSALEAGAAAYVTCPPSVPALIEQIWALVRRGRMARRPAELPSTQPAGRYCLDPDTLRVWIENRSVQLTPTEYRILAVLVGARGRQVGLARLAMTLSHKGANPLNVRTHIHHLRRKLGAMAADLVAARGGYLLRG
jgi:two-component system KDP operon response regulator KdpE